jgi:hypothetical protein
LIDYVGRPIALASTYNLLKRNVWRKLKHDTYHPKSDPAVRAEFKKIPDILEATIKEKNKPKLPLCLMFQDEARFGRMSIPISC